MLKFWLHTNWLLIVVGVIVYGGLALAQEVPVPPLPAPSLPKNPVGYLDMIWKSSPFLIGAMNLYLPTLLTGWLPGLVGKLPPAAVKLIGALLTILASAVMAMTSQEAMGGIGGVQPEVAMTETLMTNAALYRGTDVPKADEKSKE